jgi:hypothetical protein
MKINLRPIEAFQVTDDAGNVIAVAHVDGHWQGMLNLTATDGQQLIVDEPGPAALMFAQAISRIGSPSTLCCTLIKCSPDLLAKLQAPPAADGTRPATHKERAAT